MFTRYSQTVLPVVVSTQTSASCVFGPTTIVACAPSPHFSSPTRVHVYNFPFITTGLDIPATASLCHATFSLVNGSNDTGRFFSLETPFWSGPRHCAQSPPH